jgi:hypothetical protein
VLLTYNTQINSRILGDVLLFALFSAEACAMYAVEGTAGRVALWSAATVLTALIIMTHKMTLQLYTVLLPFWALALHSVRPILALVGGVAIYVAIVGPRFAVYQFRAHWDIVRFWNRHWPRLGAHQFHDSPIYGAVSAACSTCFHKPGIRGVLCHLRMVVSYAPTNLVLPLASLATGIWPPPWLLMWLAGIYIWAFTTLFVPALRCLGGGHLYVFNAVAPGACYVAWLPDAPMTGVILAVGILLNAVSIVAAWRIVRGRSAGRDEMFHQAVSALATRPTGRVAVFPLQSAEAVAWATPHAVLWGGHSYGFSRMEGFFPVLTEPLSRFLREFNIRWMLCDDRFWSGGADRLRREGMTIGQETVFGHWRLTECYPTSDDRHETAGR